ncbi:MAG: CPBP family intramembrane metalloprotease [bacterium]|nr:CPBP family intramembrane metalloprotease [bacterium]
MRVDPPPIAATSLLHQEGVLGVIALVGLTLRDRSPLAGLAPVGQVWQGITLGLATGCAAAGALWLAHRLSFFRQLESWQRGLLVKWTTMDAVFVAIFSGLAEEALLRALAQPLVGLVPAAIGFALLHVLPDRRLWLWPVIAFVMGIAFGLLFDRFGFPAAAVAHAVVNLIGLVRLTASSSQSDDAQTNNDENL